MAPLAALKDDESCGQESQDLDIDYDLSSAVVAERLSSAKEALLHAASCAHMGVLPPDPEHFETAAISGVHALESVIRVLQGEGARCALESFGRHGSQRRFKLSILCDLMRLIQSIATKDVASHISLALRASASPLVQTAMDQALRLSKPPSAGTLHHMAFVADLALMYCQKLLWQRLFTSSVPPALFAMFDSSTTAGHDWLLGHVVFIPGDHLLLAAETYRALVSFCWCHPEDRELWTQDMRDQALRWAASLEAMIHKHTLVPVALGSGRCGVVRKFQALCHSFWLETLSSQLLKQCLENVYWITTDLGAEAQLTDVPPTPFQEVLGSYVDLKAPIGDDNVCSEECSPDPKPCIN